MKYAVGVDAGDTFTDAVLFELSEENVGSVAKVPTTHDDLSRGIFKAIDEVVGDIDEDKVARVSLSSTLATNSIVEGRGGPVGLLMLGWSPERGEEFPRTKQGYIPGRFNPRGEEIQPLNTSKVEPLVHEWGEEVVGYAVSGYFSVRNPQHENEVGKIIERHTDKPVIVSHDLSPELGFYERAVTTVLNVKIIPIINSFIDSASKALKERGIEAPVTVVKSDGSLAKSSEIKKRPIETIFSGPAASVIGARWLSGKNNGVVVDIGGTTVDIGILKDGLPSLDKSGVQVGKWRTKVKSLDLHTVGLGGDSRIEVDKEGNLAFGPKTAKPLAFGDLSKDELDSVYVHEDSSFLARREGGEGILEGLSEPLSEFFRLIGEETVNRSKLLDMVRERGLVRSSYYLRELERLGIVKRVALTPTDLLHVVGEYTEGNREVSRAGIDVLAQKMEWSGNLTECAEEIKESFEKEIAHEMVKKFILDEEPGSVFDGNYVWDYFRKGGSDELSVNLLLNLPLIGIGAPAGVFLPRVASWFGADFVEVEHYSVGNAVGTVTGRVTRRFEVLLVENQEEGNFTMFLPDERKVIEEEEEGLALEQARKYSINRAKEMVRKTGGKNTSVSVDAEDFSHGRAFIDVVAVGRPELKDQV
ncbi:hydantoinase/oxoprolinase family protein [Candidatus Bipolaricaulota bacterium]|nr:hydantoinase/oxoprolinase family protein [Candidatus Bipolaricaulota bacterium]